MKNSALITAYLLDGKGGGKKISWDDINQWTPEQGLLWVHLNFTTRRAKDWLNQKSGLDKVVIKSLTLNESRPRCTTFGNGTLLQLRGINLNPGQDPEDMVSIRIWAEKDRIITTRRRALLSVGDLCDAIDSNQGPKTTADFIVLLNELLIDRMSITFSNIEDNIDMFEESVMNAQTGTLRSELSEVRRIAVLVKRYLAPQREALLQLQNDSKLNFDEYQRLQIREAQERLMRHIENIDASRDRASIMQEEIQTRVSEQLEKRMYALSIVSLIFLPLTFFSGLLGMNVGGLPGAHHPMGFLYVCIGLGVVVIALIIILKRKGWI